jgi:hypothetical protein
LRLSIALTVKRSRNAADATKNTADVTRMAADATRNTAAALRIPEDATQPAHAPEGSSPLDLVRAAVTTAFNGLGPRVQRTLLAADQNDLGGNAHDIEPEEQAVDDARQQFGSRTTEEQLQMAVDMFSADSIQSLKADIELSHVGLMKYVHELSLLVKALPPISLTLRSKDLLLVS